MDSESPTQRRDELIITVQETEARAREAMHQYQDMIQHAHLVIQVAPPFKDMLQNIPADSHLPRETWDRKRRAWKDAYCSFDSIAGGGLPTGYSASSATLAASDLSDTRAFPGPLPPRNKKRIRKDLVEIAHIIGTASRDEELEAEFVRLGLGQARSDKRSALELYRQAHDEYRIPSAGQPNPTAVLLTVRECIHRALDDLLKKCPQQQRTKNAHEKVRFICQKIGRSGLDSTRIDDLAVNAKEIVQELSAAKQADFDADEVRILFGRASLFVKSLLLVLDHERMKK